MNVKVDATQAIVIELDTVDEDAANDIAEGLRSFLQQMTFGSNVRVLYDAENDDESEVGC